MNDLAGDPAHESTWKELERELKEQMALHGDTATWRDKYNSKTLQPISEEEVIALRAKLSKDKDKPKQAVNTEKAHREAGNH